MSKYAKRKDGNHDEIKAAFEAAGWFWLDMFRFPGQLDGEIVRVGKRGLVCVIRVEVKRLGETLTQAEEKFIDNWSGYHIIAYTPTDALHLANGILSVY